VTLLEARDRVGGRGLTVRLGSGIAELGGSWFTAGHHEVRAELARYGQPVRDYAPVAHARWRTGGELRRGLPVPWDELGALERILGRVAAESEAYAAGDASVAPGSGLAYIDGLDPPPATRDFLIGWWQLMAGAPPETAAAGELLGSIAAHGGPSGLITCLAHGPADGWSALAEALAGTTGVAVRLTTAVAAVSEQEGTVTVETAAGERLHGRAAVVAVPVNCLPQIAFAPPLPGAAAEASGANAGCAVKLVLLARGVEPRGLAVGHDPALPLRWWYADEPCDGATRLVAFGWRDGFDPNDPAQVPAALRGYFPEAELVEVAWHDWNADPYARGTWLTVPADRPHLFDDPAAFDLPGRVVLAGSDVAREEAGWFEGALRSGAAAAERVAAVLGREAGGVPAARA
jgi:monoamine oxidase